MLGPKIARGAAVRSRSASVAAASGRLTRTDYQSLMAAATAAARWRLASPLSTLRHACSARTSTSHPHQHSHHRRCLHIHTQQYPSIRSDNSDGRAKTPLLIIHGLLGSSSNWRTLGSKPQLSLNRMVMGMDVRNHGASEHSADMSFDSMVEDIVGVCDRYEWEDVILLGHSLGGKIAMATALTHPQRVKALCVADISPVEYHYHSDKDWQSIGNIVKNMLSVDLATVESREQVNQQLKDSIIDQATRSFVLQNLVYDRESKKFHWRCNLELLQQKLGQLSQFPYQQQQYDKPTLFVRGQKSGYVRDSHSQLIKHMFPQSQIETIEGAGHWLHAERPTEFLQRVGDWLEQVDKPR